MHKIFYMIVAITVVATVGIGNKLRAQKEPVRALLQAGEYRDLGIFRRLKLGAASLVDTDLVKKVAIAYAYRIELVQSANGRELAEAYWRAGALGVGNVDDDGAILVETYQHFDELEKAWLGESENKMILVTSEKNMGSIEGNPVVSWEPQGKLLPVNWSPSSSP